MPDQVGTIAHSPDDHHAVGSRLPGHQDACCDYLVQHRWPLGVRCARCGSDKVGEVSTMKNHWQCYHCAPDTSYRFSHITNTIFENTNKPLRDWFRVIHMMLTAKKGVSALQVMRTMGFGSYKTAWYMCHRVRGGLANEQFTHLMGIFGASLSAAWSAPSTSQPQVPPAVRRGIPVPLQQPRKRRHLRGSDQGLLAAWRLAASKRSAKCMI